MITACRWSLALGRRRIAFLSLQLQCVPFSACRSFNRQTSAASVFRIFTRAAGQAGKDGLSVIRTLCRWCDFCLLLPSLCGSLGGGNTIKHAFNRHWRFEHAKEPLCVCALCVCALCICGPRERVACYKLVVYATCEEERRLDDGTVQCM